MWREQGLGQHTLVQVKAEHVAAGEEAQHHTQSIETQVTDGKVEGPPRAQTCKQQEIDGCEGRRHGNTCEEEEKLAKQVIEKETGDLSVSFTLLLVT